MRLTDASWVQCIQNYSNRLTVLRVNVFPLVVLLLQLRISPGSQRHSALATVTGHSYRLPCEQTTKSTTDFM